MLVVPILAKWWINTDAVAYDTSKSVTVQLFRASTLQDKSYIYEPNRYVARIDEVTLIFFV
jgi:hypothetical protein